MPEHFADRLISAVERKGSAVCIGIDPDYDRLPAEFRGENPSPRQHVEAIASFCRELLKSTDATARVFRSTVMVHAFRLGIPIGNET